MGDAFAEETERGPCAAMSTRPGPVGVCVPAVARRRSRGNQASRERLGRYSGPWRAKGGNPCPESSATSELFCSPLDVITEDSGESE